METSNKMEPKAGQTIVVWFSCGAASAVAAKMTIEKYGETNTIRIVNNPIKEEHEDNFRFLKDCEKWFGIPIEFAINSKYKSFSCIDVWDEENIMSNIHGYAPCTDELKKKARYEWEVKNRADWTVLGFTKEENSRFERFQLKERATSLYILKETSKAQCFEMVMNAGIKLPEIYEMGFPNANCIGCVKATSPTYWNLVRQKFPAIFDQRAKQSREMGTNGAKLVRVKGKRIFLDELDPKARGGNLKDLNFECGIFCSK
ncbi:hypothetical protein [Sphingobacterium mizutaii]|uniref:hypothetical protein n=1 Tax=Sphingobacterium mizutaii TaxID=1010 RepID=UPI00289CC807|nr:hypothetical protein [Sphingobacterium mizutaii]